MDFDSWGTISQMENRQWTLKCAKEMDFPAEMDWESSNSYFEAALPSFYKYVSCLYAAYATKNSIETAFKLDPGELDVQVTLR